MTLLLQDHHFAFFVKQHKWVQQQHSRFGNRYYIGCTEKTLERSVNENSEKRSHFQGMHAANKCTFILNVSKCYENWSETIKSYTTFDLNVNKSINDRKKFMSTIN